MNVFKNVCKEEHHKFSLPHIIRWRNQGYRYGVGK